MSADYPHATQQPLGQDPTKPPSSASGADFFFTLAKFVDSVLAWAIEQPSLAALCLSLTLLPFAAIALVATCKISAVAKKVREERRRAQYLGQSNHYDAGGAASPDRGALTAADAGLATTSRSARGRFESTDASGHAPKGKRKVT